MNPGNIPNANHRGGDGFDRHVLDALAHAIVVTDPDGVILYLNAAAQNLYGYTAGEAVGKPGQDLMVPPDADGTGKIIRERVASGEDSTTRIRLRRKDGSTFLARMKATPVRDGEGRITALVGMTWDITDDVQAENDLFAEKAATEALIDAIPDLVFHISRDGTHRYVHAEHPELLIEDVDRIPGRTVREILEPEAAELWMRAIERTVDERTTSRIEYAVTTIQGENRMFEGHLAPLGDDSVVAIARDITELKRIQRSLEAERDQFIEVARQAPVIMSIYRGPDHICEFANRNLIDVLGGRELIGLSARESIPELSAEGLIELMDSVYETGEAVTLKEKRVELHVDPDLPPVERFANFNYMPLRNGEGEVIGVLSHHVDITEQVVARRRLQVRNDIIQAVLKAQSTAMTARVALEGLAESIPSELSAVVLFTDESGDVIPLHVLGNGASGENRLRGLATTGVLPRDVSPEKPGLSHFRKLADLDDGGPFIVALRDEGFESLLVRTLSGGRDWSGMLMFAARSPFRDEHAALCDEMAESLEVAIRSARMLEDLEHARGRLEALNRQLVRAHEEERRALALELHDHVGQVLTSVLFALHDFDDDTLSGNARQSLERSRSLIMDLASQIRSLSLDLRPPMLDDFGLQSTLEWYRTKVAQETGISVTLTTEGISDGLLPEVVRTTAFRIIQEALTNVARHANVKEASVSVLRRDDQVLIRVRDEGRGFDPERVKGRVESKGLSGMVERVRLIDGDVTIESGPGEGTTVLGTIPIPS